MLVLCGSILVGAVAGCSSLDSFNTASEAGDETARSLPLVNALRARNGLTSLGSNSSARRAAAHQAARMAKAGRMEHLIGFNDSFLGRMKGNGVALPAAENIASGQDSVEHAIQAWIDSPKHLHNMLGSYNGLGVAMARNAASANRAYWAMVLSA